MLRLQNHTQFPLLAIIRAARNCRQSFDKMDTRTCSSEDYDRDIEILGPNDEKLIKSCIEAGHDSILEHASFTFEFTLSRCAQTQLVRHRIASFAIESMRCVQPESFICPDTISKNESVRKSYLQYMEATKDFYNEMLSAGIPMEDARYILPLATTGNIVYTSNLRALRHAIAERTCFDSQWEIRRLFNKIKNLLRRINPVLIYKCEKIYNNCKAKCGKCKEVYDDEM